MYPLSLQLAEQPSLIMNAESNLQAAPKPKLPPVIRASFTGPTVQHAFNYKPEGSSNEALGVWFLNGRAWKIFSNETKFNQFSRDYKTAKDAGLPVGSPITIEKGTVKHTREGAREITSQGFVIVAPKFTGEPWKGYSAFRSALNKPTLKITKLSPEYPRLVRDCTTARSLGLQDCQGFVRRTTTAIKDPINFTDIHLAPGRTEAAQALLDVLANLPAR